MPTYISTKCADGVQARATLHFTVVEVEFDIATAIKTAANGGGGAGGVAFVLNDIVKMIKIPAGATVVDVVLSTDALDTSTGIVLAVGDAADDDRYITGATIGRSSATGLTRMNAHTGNGFLYTSDTTIDLVIKTAASGTAAVTGKIRLAVTYTNQF